jgi:hydroxymethylbilane synthase
LYHAPTADCVNAERAMNKHLMRGCQVPIAGYATLDGEGIYLRGLVGTPDGGRILRGECRGPRSRSEELGRGLALDLMDQGAGGILASLRGQPATNPSGTM